MTRFTEGVRPTNDPSYTGLSKEPDRVKPNTGLGELFSGIGEVAGLAVGAENQRITNQVKNAVYDGVDPLRDAQGVKEGTIAGVTGNPLNLDKGGAQVAQTGGAAGGSGRPANPVVSAQQDSVARLTAAYQAGAIGSTQYFGQLEALTRQLRARFPGYREDVDAMIHKVTGVTPANALRNQIESDLASGQSAQKAAADKYETWVRQNQEYLPPDFYKKRSEGKEYNQLEVENYVTQQKIKSQASSVAKQNLELSFAQGKFVKEEGTRTLMGQANQFFDDALVKGADSVGLNDIMKRVQDVQKTGRAMSPDEQNQIRLQVGQLRLSMQNGLEKMINTPGSSGQSYATMINDNAELNKVREHVMKRVDYIEQALINGDFGALSIDTNIAKARENQVYARVIGDDFFATLQAVGRVDKAIGGIYLNNNQEKLGNAVNGLLQAQAVKRAAGVSNGFSNQLTELKLAYPDGKVPGNTVKEAINHAVTGVTDPGIDPDKKLNHAKSLYSENELGWLGRITKADQRSYVFNRMASPQVTQEMLKLKAQGGEGAQVWDNYSRWATRGFVDTMKGSFDEVSSVNDKNFKIVWDDKNKMLVPELTPEGQRFLKEGAGLTFSRSSDPVINLRQVMGTSTWNAVETINNNLRNMRPIWEGSGKDVNKEMSTVFRVYDYDPSGKQKAGKSLFDSIKGLFNSDGTPVEEGTDTERAIKSKAGQQQRSDINLDGRMAFAAGESAHPILAALAPGESGGNYNRLVSGDGTPQEADLTKMTIAQVLDYQKGMRERGHLSSAAGKYQIIRGTLQSLVNEGVVTPDDIYDEQTQEKLAMALLERRGLKDYESGKLSKEAFLKNLGDEWEAVKVNRKTAKDVLASL